MANDTWKGGSDNFTTAADWSTGAPPAATDVADIESGNPQITSNVGTVGSIVLKNASLSVEDGTLSVAAGVNNLAATLDIDNNGPSFTGTTFATAAGGSSVSVAGTLSNTGTVTVGNSSLSASTTVNIGAISSSGSLNVTGAFSSTAQATVAVAGAAGLGTAGTITGSVEISYNADLQFGSGGITRIASSGLLELEGSQATVGLAGSSVHNAALAGLSENDGTLEVFSNTIATSASNFANKGTLNVSSIGGSEGTASLAVSGMLTDSGFAYLSGSAVSASALIESASGYFDLISSSDAPTTLTLNGGTSSISGTVTGTGSIEVEGGTAVVNSGAILKPSNVTLGGNAHVEIATSASNVTTPFSFANNATATLQLDASVLPASGGTLPNTIARFATGDTVDLHGLGSPTAPPPPTMPPPAHWR